ncbi:PKD domain-containing protein, partial [Candidatus Bathyarchaeota archaeon]|nr:PKD domain-containing protein [Candidatus Bathyarchaeota archaeon]
MTAGTKYKTLLLALVVLAGIVNAVHIASLGTGRLPVAATVASSTSQSSFPSLFSTDFYAFVTGPLTVQFTGQAAGTGPFRYAWDFGDGSTGAGNPATHAYASPRESRVTLTVTDGAGVVTSNNHYVAVTNSPSLPFVPGSSPSWNSNVACQASVTTIPGMIGTVSNAQGGAALSGARTQSSPLKHALAKPCSVLGFSVFVQVNGVYITNFGGGPRVTTDCSTFADGTNSCDVVGRMATQSNPSYMQEMRWEVEREWAVTWENQWCGSPCSLSQMPQAGQVLDVQGYLFWSFIAPYDADHDYSAWYLELTAWKPASTGNPTPPPPTPPPTQFSADFSFTPS